MASRKCSATTNAGKPCGAPPRDGSDTCVSHASKEEKETLRFGGAQPGAGRPPRPKAIDIYREKVEAERDAWFKVLEDARDAERALVVGDGPTAHIEHVDDHPTRLKAFKEAHDRVFGKAMQYHDVTTREEESEVDAEIRELLAEMDRREKASANGKVPAVNGNGR